MSKKKYVITEEELNSINKWILDDRGDLLKAIKRLDRLEKAIRNDLDGAYERIAKIEEKLQLHTLWINKSQVRIAKLEKGAGD
jgi:hypothetical protein